VPSHVDVFRTGSLLLLGGGFLLGRGGRRGHKERVEFLRVLQLGPKEREKKKAKESSQADPGVAFTSKLPGEESQPIVHPPSLPPSLPPSFPTLSSVAPSHTVPLRPFFGSRSSGISFQCSFLRRTALGLATGAGA